mmetsp:Transcript_16814/g.40341  ORF Transcript_16814/g.40341 Transcript_16814/m.40341 type:complete len:278 (-) Transcript_16814:93-926(-)
MVLRDEGPVGDGAGHTAAREALRRVVGLLDDEVLDCRGVEELHVGSLEHLGQDGRREQGGVLDHNVVVLLVVGDFQLIEHVVAGLADNHGAEQLSAEPASAARADTLLDDGHFDVRVLAQLVGAAQPSTAGPDDEHIRLGVLVQVRKVTRRHLTRHLALADRGELEMVQILITVHLDGLAHGLFVLLHGLVRHVDALRQIDAHLHTRRSSTRLKAGLTRQALGQRASRGGSQRSAQAVHDRVVAGRTEGWWSWVGLVCVGEATSSLACVTKLEVRTV